MLCAEHNQTGIGKSKQITVEQQLSAGSAANENTVFA
jgi:hypothetical protein